MKRLLATWAALLLLAGCGSSGQDDEVELDDAFEMVGTISLSVGDFSHEGVASGEKLCQGRRGYSDLAPGAQVKVFGASGDLLKLGAINKGTVESGSCILTWAVADVPGGAGPYQYEVTHRGQLAIDEDAARAGLAAASIG